MANSIISVSEQVAALEPLSGAALAICLAYLALDRFRYQAIIRENAAKELKPELYQTDGVHETTPFKTLVWLAGPNAPSDCQNGKPQKRPQGFEPGCYAVFFNRPIDELIVSFLGTVAFLTLLAVVCINAKVAIWYTSMFTLLPFWITFSLLAIGAVIPVLLVLAGRRCVSWAECQSKEMAQELQSTALRMQGEARNLPVPLTQETLGATDT